jgi:hypothetical protein
MQVLVYLFGVRPSRAGRKKFVRNLPRPSRARRWPGDNCPRTVFFSPRATVAIRATDGGASWRPHYIETRNRRPSGRVTASTPVVVKRRRRARSTATPTDDHRVLPIPSEARWLDPTNRNSGTRRCTPSRSRRASTPRASLGGTLWKSPPHRPRAQVGPMHPHCWPRNAARDERQSPARSSMRELTGRISERDADELPLCFLPSVKGTPLCSPARPSALVPATDELAIASSAPWMGQWRSHRSRCGEWTPVGCSERWSRVRRLHPNDGSSKRRSGLLGGER